MNYTITINGQTYTEEETIALAQANWPLRAKTLTLSDAVSKLRMMGETVVADAKCVVGIDNGLSGGIVILAESNGDILHRTCMFTRKRNGKNEIDVIALSGWLQDKLDDMSHHTFVLEKPVGSKSLNAAKSMEASYHAIRATIEVLGGKFNDIAARTWQKEMLGKTQGDSKELAVEYATARWADEDWLRTPRCKTPDLGLIDAALIAEYTRLDK